MTLTVSASTFAAAILSASAALAMPPAPHTASPPAPAGPPVVLAQAADFNVYVDGYGREIIVDARTGQVVEVNPPGYRRFGGEPDRRQRRMRELERRSYDLSDPRDRERFRRDRQAMRGMRELPPPDYRTDPRYDDPRYDDPRRGEPLYDDPAYNGGFGAGSGERALGEAPPYDSYPDDRRPDDLRGTQGRQTRRGTGDDGSLALPEGGLWRDDTVHRAPLGEPLPDAKAPSSKDRMASVPEPGLEGGKTRPGETGAGRPLSPDVTIVPPSGSGANENVADFQVLLDRVGASPGVIDGRIGDNVNNAIDAYKKIAHQSLRTYDRDWVASQLEKTGGPAFREYVITAQDAAGPYIASLPSDYAKKAKLTRLGYTSVSEMLAERFHMAESFLEAINPGADFDRPGTIIRVADPGKPLDAKVARIEADKGREQVRAYDARGRLVAAYPATIGSKDTPSPSGTHAVSRIAFDPEYTYNPKINFQQGDNDEVLQIPPGPNGPVGTVWIALSKPSYGIHGTPEPSTIGKTASHGCVRLTNWDARELAGMVEPGVEVTFVD